MVNSPNISKENSLRNHGDYEIIHTESSKVNSSHLNQSGSHQSMSQQRAPSSSNALFQTNEGFANVNDHASAENSYLCFSVDENNNEDKMEDDDGDNDNDDLEIDDDNVAENDNDEEDDDDEEDDSDGEDGNDEEHDIDDAGEENVDGGELDDERINVDESNSDDMNIARQYRANILRELVGRDQGLVSGTSFIDVVQRLVGNTDEYPDRRQVSEFDALISNLTQREEPILIMETLSELSERLLMMNGITAERLVPSNRLAKALTDILRDPSLMDHLELHLVACRCLFNFVEVNQDFIHDALSSGAVEVLVSRIHEITYIDLTEQALQTLEMMSRERTAHSAIIESDGLSACLTNIDFLTVHAQRKCLTIVSNTCHHLNETNFSKVKDIVGKLMDVVKQVHDHEVSECVWRSISRIVDSFKSKPELLESLFADKLLLTFIVKYVSTISGFSNKDSASSYGVSVGLLQSLVTMSSTSIKLSELLLAIDVGEYLNAAFLNFRKDLGSTGSKRSLAIDDCVNEDITVEELIAVPRELLLCTLQLIAAILPANYDISDSPFMLATYRNSGQRNKHNVHRVETFKSQECDVQRFVEWTWPIILRTYLASMDGELRRIVSLCIYRVFTFFESEIPVLKSYSKDLTNVLASMINAGKTELIQAPDATSIEQSFKVYTGLQMISSLKIVKTILIKSFSACSLGLEKGGVFHDVEALGGIIHQALQAHCYMSGNADSDGSNVPEIISLTRSKFLDVSDPELIAVGNHITINHVLSKLNNEATLLGGLKKGYQSGSVNEDFATHSQLKSCFKAIQGSTNSSLIQCETAWSQLKYLLLSGSDGMSSYELLSSGVTDVMASEFSAAACPDIFTTNLGRSFVDIIFGDLKAAKHLIELLLDSLQRTESFDIVSATEKTSSRDPAHATNLARQFRLRLVPHETSDGDDDGPVIVYVQAIATFRSVEQFLKQRQMLEDSRDFRRIPIFSDKDPKSATEQDDFQFVINDEFIPTDTTIFGAIYDLTQPKSSSSLSEMWTKVHTIKFKRNNNLLRSTSSILKHDMMTQDIIGSDTLTILRLLEFFYRLNIRLRKKGLANLPDDAFRSWELTLKLRRQLEEILVFASGTQPSWTMALTREFSFLFPLESRMLFLRNTSFGYSRLINHWQNTLGPEVWTQATEPRSRGVQLGRISRQKVRISRSILFQSALKVLEKFGSSPGILEIEYYNEVGSGLGPTLEFYSMVSREFQRSNLHLWRNSDSYESCDSMATYVNSKMGLFPQVMHQSPSKRKYNSKILHLFFCLGKFLARSLFDSRIVDIELHPLTFTILRLLEKGSMHEWNEHLTLETLSSVDESLARSLQSLLDIASCHQASQEKDTIQSLELFFTLPGMPEYELILNGANTRVTHENITEYVDAILAAILKDGVIRQIEKLAEGFSTVFPMKSLNVFSPEELCKVFGSGEEDWAEATILGAIQANHGYTKSSASVIRLAKILSSFDQEHRRKFLQFLTGSPRLPIGGFKSLRPEFTVVKKNPDEDLGSDNYLPSVMTCASYLKLPDYSSIDIMRSKLIRAITEGADSFHLS
ncbi:Ubiquitin fusion degradation protein 4 [Candidozyma auris]|uniref:HECT-type E3 ubiquitin transferase n=1 Tax=Candidozyma auris TaxID=498019 RepID=A0A2H0ZJI6_CANAR|nr:hypothetical protein B9J08_004242 [[Candida] auris]